MNESSGFAKDPSSEKQARADVTQESQSQFRPSFLDAAFSPTVTASVASSLLLLVTFFLPHSWDTSGNVSRPVWTALDLLRGRTDHTILSIAALWPYTYATLLCAGWMHIARRRPVDPRRNLLALAVGSAIGLLGLWLLLLFGGSESSRVAIGAAAVVMPLAMASGPRVWWMYRSGYLGSAAAWCHSLICVLAAFSLRWCWIPDVDQMAWGGWTAIAATLLMMVGSWAWRPRARHDLVDRGTPADPIRFTVAQILLCITLSAIALAFWQALGSWRQ